MPESSSTHEFKAEIRQLLDILVHSLYTNREIFLRELTSNASDALEKVRFETGRGTEVADSDIPLEIRISTDKEAKTLTIADTGVGMTKDEIMQNIGSIAHSGSAEFLRQAQQDGKALDNLIGRFGVGFYSVYMVADKVHLTTKSYLPGQPAMAWDSDGRGSYDLAEVEDRPRGATITVYLKEDMAAEFTDSERIKAIIKRHSNFVSFPIFVDGERVNTVPALWREPKFNIKPEQYEEFYKFLTLDTEGPLRTLHVSVDAPVQFQALLFTPAHSHDLLFMNKDEWGPDLYVRRVLIERQAKELLPQYLSFISGVVDTEDLPLNISRETLQDNILLRKIATTLAKHVLTDLKKMAADAPEDYEKFWREHGKTFKLGYGDYANRDAVAELVRFNASSCDDANGLVSLEEYVGRMPVSQKDVYYCFVQSRAAAELNPHLEIFREKGVEVLYLYEPVDEFLMDALGSFKDKKLTAAEHADIEALKSLESKVEETKKPEPLEDGERQELDKLLADIKSILGDRIQEARLSSRLRQSPACLVNPDGQMTSSMDKIMRVISKDASVPTKVMELNPDHPLVRNLVKIHAQNPEDPFVRQAVEQLYESSLLLEGYLTDPHALVGRIQDLLTKAGEWRLQAEAAKK